MSRQARSTGPLRILVAALALVVGAVAAVVAVSGLPGGEPADEHVVVAAPSNQAPANPERVSEPPAPPPPPLADTPTPVTAPTPVTTPTPSSSPAPAPPPDTGRPAPTPPADRDGTTDVTALVVPALGIDVGVGEVAPRRGVIDPPRLDRAYVIDPYGRPGSDNTTYIAGHSWNAGEAVFNPLLDMESQAAVLSAGEQVLVTSGGQTYTYVVTGSQRYPKGTLADVAEVWEKVPGRLVLITCFQRNDGGASQDNLVVTAELAGSPSVTG